MSSEGIEETTATAEKTVMIVDDDRDVGEILQRIILDQTGYKVIWVAESDLALNTASYLQPSLLVLDYMLPTMDGLDLYDHLQGIEGMQGVPTIFISASSTLPFEELRSRGIHVLKKPFELDDLLDILAQLLSQ